MARLREFDQEKVLDRVIEVFWQNGYGGATIQVLEKSTGLKRGSLYNAFGDKASLFGDAYDRYVRSRSLGNRIRRGSGRPSVDVLSELLDVVTAEAADHRKGCLITNSLVELGDKDPLFAEKSRKEIVKQERLISELSEEALASGALATSHRPRQLARFLIAVTSGMQVLSKLDLEDDFLGDVARVAKTVLRGEDWREGSPLVRLFNRLTKTR